MLFKRGFTLFEMIMVLGIIGVCAALAFSNFSTPGDQAKAANLQNNLLAIYAAEQNYVSKNIGNPACPVGTPCGCLSNTPASPLCAQSTGDNNCGDNLAAINCNLSLNIQDDGTHLYSCSNGTGLPICQATIGNTPNGIAVELDLPVQLGGKNPNPVCTLARCP